MEEPEVGQRSGVTFKKLVVAAVVVTVLAGAAFLVERNATQGAVGPRYATAPVTRGDVTIAVSATGPVDTFVSSPLSFKNAGRIVQIPVQAGDRVKAGQVLATEEDGDPRAAVDQAEAVLAQAQARYASVQAGPRSEQVAQAQAALDTAETKLTQLKSPSPSDVQAAQTAVDQANSTLTSAQAKLDATKAPYTQADFTAQQAAVDTAATNLKAAQVKLTQVKAGSLPADVAAQQTAVDAASTTLIAAQDRLENWKNGETTIANGTSDSQVLQAVRAAEDGYNAAVAKLAQMMAGPLPADLQAAITAVDSAQATYSSATAKLAQMKGGPLATDVTQAQGAVDTAKTNLAAAQAKLNQLQNPTDNDVQLAQDAVTQAQQALALAKAPYTAQDIKAANAGVDQAQAGLEVARANLNAATLRAPFDGTVASVNASVGQWVTAGSGSATGNTSGSGATGVIQLMDLDRLKVVAQVNEADMARVTSGNHVDFTVNAFPGQTFSGAVTAIQPQGVSVQNVVLYNVTIAVDPTATRLLPGMTANVSIDAAQRKDVLVVPAAAISFAGSQVSGRASGAASAASQAASATVLVYADGRATPTVIQTGLSDGRNTEVLSGLALGQSVVTGKLQSSQ